MQKKNGRRKQKGLFAHQTNSFRAYVSSEQKWQDGEGYEKWGAAIFLRVK